MTKTKNEKPNFQPRKKNLIEMFTDYVFDNYGPNGTFEFEGQPLEYGYVEDVCKRYIETKGINFDGPHESHERESVREIMLFETGRKDGQLVGPSGEYLGEQKENSFEKLKSSGILYLNSFLAHQIEKYERDHLCKTDLGNNLYQVRATLDTLSRPFTREVIDPSEQTSDDLDIDDEIPF